MKEKRNPNSLPPVIKRGELSFSDRVSYPQKFLILPQIGALPESAVSTMGRKFPVSSK